MCFLGVDFGTSAVKAMLLNGQGEIIAQTSCPLPRPVQIDFSFGVGYEQDPHIWWDAFLKILDNLKLQVDLADIKAISVDGTSGTVVACDASGNPLAKALMYNDARTLNENRSISEYCRQHNIKLGNVSGLARILWFLKQPFSNEIAHFVNQADWIVGKLTGQFNSSDHNNALKMAYDVNANNWPYWLSELGIKQHLLPKVYKPGAYLAKIVKSHNCLGLNIDTIIVSGTTDSTAAIMASGVAKVGQAVTSLGSTMVMKVISEHPINHEKYGIYSQPFGDYWLVGGSSNSGGAVLKHFFSQEQVEHYSQQLRPEQPTGLEYYPLIRHGERFPFADVDKLPVLSPRPDNDSHFFQAMLEGMANIEFLAYKKLHELGAPYPTSIVTMGGGANNLGWKRIREIKLQVPLNVALIDQAAYGTAKLALSAYRNR